MGAPHALATRHEGIAGQRVSWVYDAALRHCCGSFDQGWLLRLAHHRVGAPRILRVIRRWRSAGVLEDGGPQGGSVRVGLRNL